MFTEVRRAVKRWYSLPGPKELGRADCDALQSRDFTPDIDDDVYTWESWDEEVKTRFPIRYFLNKTLVWMWQRSIGRGIRHASEVVYWMKCHTLRSHRFHLLDLRQPPGSGGDRYTHGYLDPCDKITYACFNSLLEYWNEDGRDKLKFYSTDPEFADKPDFRKPYEEMQALLDFWLVERKRDEDKMGELIHDAFEKKTDRVEYRRLMDEYSKLKDKREADLQNALKRLIDVREYLWN